MGYGINIRQHREALGMSQAELARIAGVSRPSITAYEDEKRKPKWETWVKLARALRCDITDLNPATQGEPILRDFMEDYQGPSRPLKFKFAPNQHPVVPSIQVETWDCMLEPLEALLNTAVEGAYFQTTGNDLFVIALYDTSMEPVIRPRDLILVQARTTMPENGQPCVVKFRSGEVVCRTWYWHNGVVELRSENESSRSWKWTKEEFHKADPLEWRFPVVEQNRIYSWG